VDLIRLIGGSIILLVLDWRLAALVLIPVPILAIALRHYNTKIRKQRRNRKDLQQQVFLDENRYWCFVIV
jgi:ABC-type multidrug transport system fused ATPase/permease subunit